MPNITLAGQTIELPYTNDIEGGRDVDMEGALNSAGFLQLKDPGLDWFRSSGQGNFASPEQYWRWVYGGGNTVAGPNGQQWFQTPNGLANVVNQPLSFDAPEFADRAWMIPLGIAGAGLFAGGLGAGADAFGGFTAGAGAEGTGLIGAGEGAFGSGVTAGTGTGAAGGFNILDPSTWSNPFGNTPPGASELVNVLDDESASMLEPGIDFNFNDALKNIDPGTSNMDWTNLLSGNNWMNALGSLGSGILQYLAANKASGAQIDATNASNALLASIYNQNRADLAPYREAGYNALGQLVDLTTPGNQVEAMQLDPGYQFRFDQGMNELNNRLKAGGKFYSGDALRGGQEYAQGFASNEFGNVYNRLAGLAGTGQTAVNTGVNAGQNYGNQVGQNLLGAGNARASGYVGGANAIGNAVGGYLNNQNQMNLLAALLGRTNAY